MTKEQFCSIYDIAVKEYYDKFINDIDNSFNFSSDFEKRMAKLISNQKKPYWDYVNTAGKRVAIIIATLLALSFSSLTVKSVRDGVIERIKKVYEICVNYQYAGSKADKINVYYKPFYIPNNFIEVEDVSTDISYNIKFNDNKGRMLRFNQLLPDNLDLFYDNENSQEVKIQIGDITAEGIKSDGFIAVHWEYDSYVFQLITDSDLSDDEIIKIIKSVKPLK